MKLINRILYLVLLLNIILEGSCPAQTIIQGAAQPDKYLPLLYGKKVGLVVNQTSRTGSLNLVDFLILKQIKVKKIFVPEHGFREDEEAGATISNSIDLKTSLPIISLYNDKKKPAPQDLADLDIVVYDIQDVGCRFFTYISTLYYVMEACGENKVPLLILDRPNPNGDYVDGPVLKPELKSFVGMLPIPVVYGCTIGELAQMINGERWLAGSVQCSLSIIPVKNYSHKDRYELPFQPSPNLPDSFAVRLYPSLCFFEAINVSIGRGTVFPFQVIGYPDSTFGNFRFTPHSIPGVCKNPPQENKVCYGIDLRKEKEIPRFTLRYFLELRSRFVKPELFWSSKRWIGLLSGDPDFYNQIESGWSESEIRNSWQPDLEKYRLMRKKYLLYPDFE
jgi:uncharacterized protein YbbC (DUF1343 family)